MLNHSSLLGNHQHVRNCSLTVTTSIALVRSSSKRLRTQRSTPSIDTMCQHPKSVDTCRACAGHPPRYVPRQAQTCLYTAPDGFHESGRLNELTSAGMDPCATHAEAVVILNVPALNAPRPVDGLKQAPAPPGDILDRRLSLVEITVRVSRGLDGERAEQAAVWTWARSYPSPFCVYARRSSPIPARSNEVTTH